MSHLNTAFQLGAVKAAEDFNAKLAQGGIDLSGASAPPAPRKPEAAPAPTPAPTKRQAPAARPLKGHQPSAPPVTALGGSPAVPA